MNKLEQGFNAETRRTAETRSAWDCEFSKFYRRRAGCILGCILAFGSSLGTVEAQEKVTFQDHVLPLIEANCAKCHNAEKKKADLELTSYQSALKGSGSGVVVASGNPDGSKLWKVLSHAEEPFMPPNRPKLPDQELDVFKRWIAGGLLESASGHAVAAASPGLDLTLKAGVLARPDGPPPMPQDLPLEPVVHTRRMSAITGLAASPWAPLLAVAGQKQVLLFNTETFELMGILPFPEGQPVDLKFSRNGKLLLASGGIGAKTGRAVVWDVLTGDPLINLGAEYDTVLAADIRPDQSQIAFGGPNRLVKIFSTKSGELQFKMKKHTDWVTEVAFSPDGQILATADRNGGISLWDPDRGQELFALVGHKSAVTALSWRADSKLLASSSEDGTIKIWETKEGKRVKSWIAHKSGTLCATYASNGRLVSCGRDNAVTLWEGNGSKLRAFEFFGNMPIRLAINHDGTRIAATDFAGRVVLWNAADGKRLTEFDPNPMLLRDQIAAAEQRVSQLETKAWQATRDGSGNRLGPIREAALSSAKAALNRLQAARVLSYVYELRENLSRKKIADRQALAAELENDHARMNRLLSYYRSLVAEAGGLD